MCTMVQQRQGYYRVLTLVIVTLPFSPIRWGTLCSDRLPALPIDYRAHGSCDTKAVTSIQVADEIFVAAAPELVAAVIADRGLWRQWWPDLSLTVTEDRGPEGMRWTVTGGVTGTMELWCEAVMDGFVLHYYLHAEPTKSLPDNLRARADELAEQNRLRRVAGKEMSFDVKQRLEAGREPGDPAIAGTSVREQN